MLVEQIKQRATAIKKAGNLQIALDNGVIPNNISVSTSEAVVLGLLKQGVTKYLGILGHGNTDLGEILRIYEEVGLLKFYPCRNEVSMAHAATALSWIYGEITAVVASIGPGSIQAYAGSLAAASNGVGVYHIYGDETTYGEGYNMQQIPKPHQNQFGNLTSIVGESYTLHTPEALREALHRGLNTVKKPYFAGPFFLCLPINVQPQLIENLNLKTLPSELPLYPTAPFEPTLYQDAVNTIANHSRISIKVGGGGRKFSKEITLFAELAGAAVVLSPASIGTIKDAHPLNMHVGGSKGSLSGNYAMENCDLLIVIGSRAVCQSDCSGTGYPNAQKVININGLNNDVSHYNNTLMLNGDIGLILNKLNGELKKLTRNDHIASASEQWKLNCLNKKHEWIDLRNKRTNGRVLFDDVWQRNTLTQPSAVATVIEFANSIDAIKVFDAGDVQANGFQVINDDHPFNNCTDTGSSYMGFASSALMAAGVADNPKYMIGFTGDGSFMMNPQILIDAVVHNAHATLVIFDNRRMGAISSLQVDQFGPDFGTNDDVAVDYAAMANSVRGVKGIFGGFSKEELLQALKMAYAHKGLAVIHVPVYWGHDKEGGMGTYGRWNVGPWVENVQSLYLEQSI